MTLAELIPATAVQLRLAAPDVDGALAELASLLARAYGLDARQLEDDLRAREELGSTALGEGIAIPHARAEVPHTVGVFAISSDGIPWDAPDGGRVHLVVALLSPQQGSEHLIALARVAGVLVDPALRKRLLAASGPATLHALLAAAG